MKGRSIAIILGFTLAIVSFNTRADEVFTFVVKKQEEKAKSRWSLQEWIDTRDRMRLMDLWLAMHSPSPYEFFGGIDFRFLGPADQPLTTGARLSLGAYASIFGVSSDYTFNPFNEWIARFHVRLLGAHFQATHLTPHVGFRSNEVGRNGFVGWNMTIYLGKFFGLDGSFDYHFPFKGLPSSWHLEAGGFIEFQFVRMKLMYDRSTSNQGFSVGSQFFL